MREIKFSKMVATGNDFIVFDNRSSRSITDISLLARKLCDRRTGIGGDGLLLVERSKVADFKMRIFNPDCSEPDMCGNGSRCIALFARLNKIAPSRMRIETKAGLLKAVVKKNLIKINMTDPHDMRLNLRLTINNKDLTLYHLNTGVPHAVCFIKPIEKVNVDDFGRKIRESKAFLPDGVNANFVEIKKRKRDIFMRTYERGVEAETFACGTGAVASAIISSVVKSFKSPVKVFTRGGELNIYFKSKNNKFYDVYLEGEAREVFTGTIKV
ncbi:diaminopimelate epimerase [Candidatus Omnitrophota bacterium]